MKSKLKNKKVLAALIGVALLLVSIIGVMTVNKQIVFAKDGTVLSILNPIEALAETEEKFEVKIKYVFSDEKVFKEEIIKADKGQILDSGDLPMLPDDMKFIDDFLYYEVKGDGQDEIIRKVEKIVKDKATQTENEKDKEKKPEEAKQDKATQIEERKKDSSTQTDITKNDLDKMDKESKELKEKIDNLSKELKDKDKLSDKQKDKIKNLEDEIEALEKKIKKDKDSIDSSKENIELKKSIEELEKKTKELQEKLNSVNKIGTNVNPTISNPVPKNNESFSKFIPSTPINTGKGSDASGNVSTTSKTENKVETKSDKKEEKQEIRYPNKLTPKQTSSNGDTTSMDGSSKPVNTNKGVASAPSKARGSVTENKDNANKDYPIHHNDGQDNKSTDMYSADARQFVTFTTKNGKTFHLIINHDEDSENVMLLTEVSEEDLLNMVEKKETQKEIVKEEPIKEEPKPVKKEESSNMGTYLILILVVAGALGAGYYFKVVKKKENEELEALEDDDDDFFSEADESEEISEIEDEEIKEDEE